MPTIGLGEILIILTVALIVIGPQQLPETARKIGIFLHGLKTNANVLKDDILGRPDKNE
ncbi:MAG: twin-arginine translocase TatA/TatE family subunit [Alphaproteobacteria bacterium]|nr:twin-arginine translocase TatA/TatE family subunit [Alphaproteobacteria bacterium]MDD9920175.1 twin-arginine translocase TatA/TatE family subunit [Alphaproteobacteria bacterium]